MADEVITDTASIRTAFIESVCLNLPHLSETVGADFDAWLEAERQTARNEGHREGYETACADLVSGAFISGVSYEAVRNSFTGQQIAKEASDETAKAIREEILAIDRPYANEWEERGSEVAIDIAADIAAAHIKGKDEDHE